MNITLEGNILEVVVWRSVPVERRCFVRNFLHQFCLVGHDVGVVGRMRKVVVVETVFVVGESRVVEVNALGSGESGEVELLLEGNRRPKRPLHPPPPSEVALLEHVLKFY